MSLKATVRVKGINSSLSASIFYFYTQECTLWFVTTVTPASSVTTCKATIPGVYRNADSCIYIFIALC